jgi:hypothetical protein
MNTPAAVMLMLVPLFLFIGVCLVSFAGFIRLSARLLKTPVVAWKHGFVFGGILCPLLLANHAAQVLLDLGVVGSLAATALYCAVYLAFGTWFFGRVGKTRDGGALGTRGAVRLVALAMALMLAVGALLMIVQVAIVHWIGLPA